MKCDHDIQSVDCTIFNYDDGMFCDSCKKEWLPQERCPHGVRYDIGVCNKGTCSVVPKERCEVHTFVTKDVCGCGEPHSPITQAGEERITIPSCDICYKSIRFCCCDKPNSLITQADAAVERVQEHFDEGTQFKVESYKLEKKECNPCHCEASGADCGCPCHKKPEENVTLRKLFTETPRNGTEERKVWMGCGMMEAERVSGTKQIEEDCTYQCPRSTKLEKRLCEHYYTKHEENEFRDAVISHLVTLPFVDGEKKESRDSWYKMCNALRSRFLK